MQKITQGAFILMVVLLAVNACKTDSKTDKVQHPGSPDSSLVSVKTAESTEDTIVYDEFYFPDDTNFMAKILTTGIFHEDEVWTGADQLKWFGLFYNRSNVYLAETKITASRVHDEISDDSEDDKTGWEIKAMNQDTAYMLIAGLDFLKNRKIEPLYLPKRQLIPGDSLKFNHLGVEYCLYATGNKRKHDEDGVWYEIWNYRLYLAAKINNQWKKDLLVACPSFDDAMIDLIFAGDIDGDGFLDLIIDTSNHYNGMNPTLFLSKPAEKGHLIKVVGEHGSVGC